MCGLFGFSGEEINPLAIKLGLLENESRGKHSTGVYGLSMFKYAGAASEAIQDPSFAQAIDGAKAVIGHTRFATMGAHTVENAHPFLREHEGIQIVGTHNGWIIDESLKRAIAGNDFLDDVAVDSMLIFDLLLKTGYDWDSLSQLDGSMALGVIDNEGLLNLYKRQSKPLFLGYHENGLYYSSLEEALTLIDCEDIEEVPNDTCLKFDQGKLVDAFKVDDPSITSIPLDCGASSWRYHASDEEKALYPQKKSRWDYQQGRWVDEDDPDYKIVNNGGTEGCQSSIFRNSHGHRGSNGSNYSMVPSSVGDKLTDDVDGLIDKMNRLKNPDYEMNNIVKNVLNKKIKANIEAYGTPDTFDAESDLNNGFNNVFMLVLALQDQDGNSHPNLYVVVEEDPTIAGFTDQDGEIVLVVNRKNCEIDNGNTITLQVQDPMDLKLVERIETKVSYRKTRDAWFTMNSTSHASETADNISSGSIEQLKVNSELTNPAVVNPQDVRFDRMLKDFYEQYPQLNKSMDVAYWKGIGFDTAFNYEVAFWKYLKDDGIISIGKYFGVSEGDNQRKTDWLDRVDYTSWNLAWGKMTPYERDKRIDFHKDIVVKQIDNAYEEFEEKVESALALSKPPTQAEIASLREEGADLLEFCETFGDEYNALAGSLNVSFIQELNNKLKNYSYATQE